ncbi:MAG: spore photoproduct lyase family protein [Candidatus Omnitrophota bacterium]
MQFHKNAASLLKAVKTCTKRLFPLLGVNKTREIERLLYEIAKRDHVMPKDILPKLVPADFSAAKALLLRKRYPEAHKSGVAVKPYLPDLIMPLGKRGRISGTAFCPKYIYAEKAAADSWLTLRARALFPKARYEAIASLKSFVSNRGRFTIEDYNRRRETLFIVMEKFDFLKPCPCTKHARGCGYHILNIGTGCIFDCSYCYLQRYINTPGIVIPANIDSFFGAFGCIYGSRRHLRIGSGEFSDSLMLDHLTSYAPQLVSFFKGYPDASFEFKTKSANVENLLKAGPGRNIVVSWSLNPPEIIAENEPMTSTLPERLKAAKLCRDAGYRIGIHFDPIIRYTGWENDYTGLIHTLFTHVLPGDIAWISLGTLRFRPDTKKVIEARFPENSILNGELLIDFDGKLRYPYPARRRIYRTILDTLLKYSPRLPVYLCMEETRMWKDLGLIFPFRAA